MLLALADTNFWDKINDRFGNSGGIYKVVAIKNNELVIINRLLGSDKDGVLYIGKAISYLDRVISLKKSTAPKYKSSSHEFGIRYKQHALIKIHFPFDTLYVRLQQSDTPEELEYTELKTYFEKFGELPPLNRQDGKSSRARATKEVALTLSQNRT